MPDRLARLEALERFHDGPIPRAALAAALGFVPRRGTAAHDRMALDAVVAAAGCRRALPADEIDRDARLLRLVGNLAWNRTTALSCDRHD